MVAPSRLSRLSAIVAVAVVVCLADPQVITCQSQAKAVQDTILGTWALNVAKSKYSPGPAPRSQVRTYAAHPQGVKATIQTVYADGRSATTEYVANYDGVE